MARGSRLRRGTGALEGTAARRVFSHPGDGFGVILEDEGRVRRRIGSAS